MSLWIPDTLRNVHNRLSGSKFGKELHITADLARREYTRSTRHHRRLINTGLHL